MKYVTNLLLAAIAIVSGIAMLHVMANDPYGPAWGMAIILSGFYAIIGAIIWKFFTFITGHTFWLERRARAGKNARENQSPIAKHAHILFLCGTILYLFCYLPASSCVTPGEYGKVSICRCNLKSISLALLNYEQAYGCFPPAYIADETGKPMHSWRVLLLPYLECWDKTDLEKQYDFNEPWDGPNNRKLIENIPSDYVCPEDEYSKRINRRPGTTSYLAVVSDTGVWRGAKPVAFGDLKHNSHDTVLLIENADAEIAWTEPRDVSLDEIENAIGGKASSVAGISAKHRLPAYFPFNSTPGGVHVARADGIATFVPANYLKPEKLKDILAAGGCPDKLVHEGPYNFVNWWNFGVLFAFVASVYLLLRRAAKEKRAAA